jgi:alpha-1,6-mannosyltransferase
VLVLAFVGGCVGAAWAEDSPLVPGLGGKLAGDTTWAWLYLACEVAAFVAYLVGLAFLRRHGSGSGLVAVAVLAAAIQLAPLGAPLLISSDAWTYWDYGRIAAVHDANPYVQTPSDFPRDPAFPYVGSDWRDTTAVYGPLFTLASEPVALAVDDSADAAAWTYKTLAALAVLAATGLAAFMARRRVFACAFVGWNPLLALQFAGGGHNDAWMVALVLAALAAGATGRRQWAGVAWVCAIAVKWVPLVLFPLRVLEARAQGRRVGHLGFATAAAGVVALAFMLYGHHWIGAFAPLARNATRETSYSLPHRLEALGLPDALVLGLLAAAFGLAYVWLLRQAARGRARLGLTAGLLLLATPYLAPWYAVWAIPLAAAEEDRAAQLLALGLSAYLLRQAVPL